MTVLLEVGSALWASLKRNQGVNRPVSFLEDLGENPSQSNLGLGPEFHFLKVWMKLSILLALK